jgi:hypothetical protein
MKRRKRKLTVITRRVRPAIPTLPASSLLRVFRLLTFGLLPVLLGMLPTALRAEDGASPQQQGTQKPYALIFGTVWGPDNRPLYGVKVKIRRAEQKKAKWELFSDHSGEFAQRLPAGKADYLVWADLKSYKSLTGKQLKQDAEVPVHIENDERADIGLHLK